MKISEFVDYMKKSVNRTMKDDQILSVVKKKLDVKDYISIKEKRALVDNIINASVLYENGVYKFDCIGKYVYFTMYTIAACTNIELSENVEDDFDALSREALLPVVICAIQKEYDDVNILLQMQCDSFLENNSVESMVGRFLEGVTDLLNNIEPALKSGIDKMSDLKFDKDVDLNQLLSIFNKN